LTKPISTLTTTDLHKLMASASARLLLEEFLPWVRRYNAGAFVLGLGFGAWDGPPGRQPSGREASSPSAAKAGLAEDFGPPRELGFWRQFAWD
ncbi:unnamed protein product, partial [Polarella glacialis]